MCIKDDSLPHDLVDQIYSVMDWMVGDGAVEVVIIHPGWEAVLHHYYYCSVGFWNSSLMLDKHGDSVHPIRLWCNHLSLKQRMPNTKQCKGRG